MSMFINRKLLEKYNTNVFQIQAAAVTHGTPV